MKIEQRLDPLNHQNQRIDYTELWRLMKVSILVVMVGLLPLSIGCNYENNPSVSDPSAKKGEGNEAEALREFQRAVATRAMAIPPEKWNDKLKAAIVKAGWDLDEFTEGIRQRQAHRDDGED